MSKINARFLCELLLAQFELIPQPGQIFSEALSLRGRLWFYMRHPATL
jgi:hypothetical protein